jgi:Zn-dependent M28 family amino/carboxypeptidase
VVKVLSKLSATQYQQYMTTLTQGFLTRYSCSPSQLTVRDSINNIFKQFGLTTNLGTFTNSCRSGCKSATGYNVIGIKKGLVRPQDYYLVGAHYDSISGSPCQSAPGANDNASGMAGVMELARVFSQLNTEASLIFAAFGGEELGMLGSKKYVQTLVNSGMKPNLKAFVILDMVSFYDKHRGVIIEGSNRTAQQSAALKRLAGYGSTYTGLTLETTTDYGDSDHEPFLNKGMAGALLMETDWSNYRYYHTIKDQMAYQDIPYGLEILKMTAALLAQEAKVISVP